MGYFLSRLNLLEGHTRFLHPSAFSFKCTWVVERGQSQEWVRLFPRKEQPMQLFPATSLHALMHYGILSFPTVGKRFVWAAA